VGVFAHVAGQTVHIVDALDPDAPAPLFIPQPPTKFLLENFRPDRTAGNSNMQMRLPSPSGFEHRDEIQF
jgi:hypothetical protein